MNKKNMEPFERKWERTPWAGQNFSYRCSALCLLESRSWKLLSEWAKQQFMSIYMARVHSWAQENLHTPFQNKQGVWRKSHKQIYVLTSFIQWKYLSIYLILFKSSKNSRTLYGSWILENLWNMLSEWFCILSLRCSVVLEFSSLIDILHI